MLEQVRSPSASRTTAHHETQNLVTRMNTLHRRTKAKKEEGSCIPEHVFCRFSLNYLREGSDKIRHITIRDDRWTARTNRKAHKNPADVELDTNKELQNLLWTVCLTSWQMNTFLVGGIITMGEIKISRSRKGRIENRKRNTSISSFNPGGRNVIKLPTLPHN